MRKKVIGGVAAALGLGTVLAFVTTNVASAAPAGMGGLAQRVEVVSATATGGGLTSVEPTCRDDEILTGGGYTVGSIGFSDKVLINAPLNDKTWLVQVFVDGPPTHEVDVWAHAVCLGRGR